jgi:hypothetical protein
MGWGSPLHSSITGHPRVCSGIWSHTMWVPHGRLDATWMTGFTLDSDSIPESPNHRHLSILFSIHTSPQVARLSYRPVVIRPSSVPAIRAFQHGPSGDPILPSPWTFSPRLQASFICPRFFAALPEPAAEGQDTFGQPSSVSSLCPVCTHIQPEFVLLYHPFTLIRVADSIRQAQAD